MYSLEDIKNNKKFNEYYEALVEWNNKFNLTSVTEKEEVYLKHFYDSILPHSLIKKDATVLDIGAGAGFPSIPLKIIRDDLSFTLIDSVNKKVTFLNYIINKLNLTGIKAIHTRVEDFNKKEQFDYVLARALAPLNVLCEYSLPFLKIANNNLNNKDNTLNKNNTNNLGNKYKTININDDNTINNNNNILNKNNTNSLGNKDKTININDDNIINNKDNIINKNYSNINNSQNILKSNNDNSINNGNYDCDNCINNSSINTKELNIENEKDNSGVLIAYKSQNIENEINISKNALNILGGKLIKIKTIPLNNEINRSFVLIKKVNKTPPAYPRGKNKPRLNPL